MKTFLFLVLLGVVATSLGAEKRDKRGIFDLCSDDSECGFDRCCAGLGRWKYCYDKRGHGKSCNFSHLHGCGCKDGLSCQVYKEFLGVKYRKCFPEPGSGDGF